MAYVLATDSDFSGTTNGNFKYIGSHEYVTIPHVIKGVNVTSFNSMFSGNSVVKGVASDNPNITSCYAMFQGCTTESLDLRYLDLSNVFQMSLMFAECTATTIDLSGFNTSSAVEMEEMFAYSSIDELDLRSFDTSNVKYMTRMFDGCSAENIDVSSFDTSKVTSMHEMFASTARCYSIDVSHFDTSSVIYMGGMFSYTRPKTLDLRNFDTSNVTSMSEMFFGSEADNIYLTSFNTENVSDFSKMFQLTYQPELDLSSFNFSNAADVMDTHYMFYNCYTPLVYARTETDMWAMTGSYGFNQTIEVRIKSSGAPTYITATDSDFSGTTNHNFKYIGSYKYVTIPHVIKGVNVTSYRSMFEGVQTTDLRGVKSTNPNVTDMQYMFKDNNSFVLDLSNLNTSGVLYMNYMFQGSRAKNLDLTGFDTSNVTGMRSMFKDCEAVVIDVSSFDTSNVNNLSFMFSGCEFTSLDISNFNTSSVEYMEGVFQDCKVESLDLSGFDTSNCTIMGGLFWGCEATTIDISSFDTSKVVYMSDMFRNCKATFVNLLGFDTSSVIYMKQMFQHSQLTMLDLSSFDVSNVEFENMYNMFSYSSALHGFAGSAADAIKFNQTTNKPSSLNFIVRLGANDPFYWYKPDIDNELDTFSPYPYGWFSYGRHVANAPRYFGRHYFRIGDSAGDPKSTDYGIQLLGDIELPSPERDLEEVEVLGRDGVVLIDNKRFKPIRREIRFTVKVQEEDLTDTGMKPFRSRTLHKRLADINSWILEKPGYQPWVFSMYPNYTYYARVVEPFLFHDVSKHYARGVINLEMMPYMDEMWYYSNLGSPAEPPHYTTEVEWEGDFPIKPIFEIDLYGVTKYTAAKVINGAVLGGRLFELKVRAGRMNKKVIVDCEKETVTYGGEPLDALLQVSDGFYSTFPVINPGEKFGIMGVVEMEPGYSPTITNPYGRVKWPVRRLAI